MKRFHKYYAPVSLILFLIAAHQSGHAQTLTIAIQGSNSVNFNLVQGSATNLGSNTISVRTSWVLGAQNRNLTVYCFFANSAAALTGGGVNIPSSAVSISTNGTPFRPLIISEPFGGANAGRRIVADIPITGTGNRTDSVDFNIDLTAGTLPQLQAGTYTGTLSIRAQAI